MLKWPQDSRWVSADEMLPSQPHPRDANGQRITKFMMTSRFAVMAIHVSSPVHATHMSSCGSPTPQASRISPSHLQQMTNVWKWGGMLSFRRSSLYPNDTPSLSINRRESWSVWSLSAIFYTPLLSVGHIYTHGIHVMLMIRVWNSSL